MNEQQAIEQVEKQWVDIYLTNDADKFAELLTDDFMYTSPVCEVVNRADYLKNLRDKTVVMDYARASDTTIRVHNDTAIVTALWHVKEAYRGQSFEGPCRITRVWLRQNGTWKAIAFHVTECQEQK